MIVCSCRVISDREFQNKEDLQQRLLADDVCCGSCIEELEDPPLTPDRGSIHGE